MPKSKKKSKRKPHRKYGQQDKIVFRRVVRQETVQQEHTKTIKERLIETKERQQAGREQQEKIKRAHERVLPPSMSYTEYMEYIEKKKAEAREKGVHFRY